MNDAYKKPHIRLRIRIETECHGVGKLSVYPLWRCEVAGKFITSEKTSSSSAIQRALYLLGFGHVTRTMNGALETAKTAVQMLTCEQRMEVFQLYCCYCGRADPRCGCWNDE